MPAQPGRIRGRRLLVVTDSRHPVQAASGARVIELDLRPRASRSELAGLPADPQPTRAALLVQQRLRDDGQACSAASAQRLSGRRRMPGAGYRQGSRRGGRSRYVVYGEADVARAVARIESHRVAHSHEPPCCRRRRAGPAAIASVLLGGPLRRSPEHSHHRLVGPCRPTAWNTASSASATGCSARTGCTVRTSVKVRHYVPDAVVSSYSNTGENPWIRARHEHAQPTAQAGGDGTTNHDNENNLEVQNADDRASRWFGVQPVRQRLRLRLPGRRHGLHAVPAEHARHAGLALQRAGDGSTRGADPRHARDRRPHDAQPVGQRLSPRRLPAPDRRLQERRRRRAARGDVVTRRMQPHVLPCSERSRDGCWPAGALVETDASRQVAGADADLELLRGVPALNTRVQANKATTPGRCGGPMPAASAAGRSSSAASISSEVFPR